MNRRSVPEPVAHLLRTNFRAFFDFAFREIHPGGVLLPNWHIDLLAEYCQAAATGEPLRLMINMPPRYLKSEMGSVSLPAFALGQDARKQILILTGSKGLGSELMIKLKKLLEGHRYRALFPNLQLSFGKTKITSRHGGSISFAAVGGQLSGRGADLIIVDDPLSPFYARDEKRRDAVNSWFDAELQTRINNRRSGSLIVLMQRVHENDLCGHLSQAEGEGFQTIALPALNRGEEEVLFPSGRIYKRRALEPLHAERESTAKLEMRLDEIGGFNFIGQYLQGYFYPWDENETQGLWLRAKRPEGWRAEDSFGPSGLISLRSIDEIKATYFQGESVWEHFGTERWWTEEEWEIGTVKQQSQSVERSRLDWRLHELRQAPGPLDAREIARVEKRLQEIKAENEAFSARQLSLFADALRIFAHLHRRGSINWMPNGYSVAEKGAD